MLARRLVRTLKEPDHQQRSRGGGGEESSPTGILGADLKGACAAAVPSREQRREDKAQQEERERREAEERTQRATERCAGDGADGLNRCRSGVRVFVRVWVHGCICVWVRMRVGGGGVRVSLCRSVCA